LGVDPRLLIELPDRSPDKSVHHCLGKKHISGVGLPLTAVTKIIKQHFLAPLILFLMFSGILSISTNSCSLVMKWAYQY